MFAILIIAIDRVALVFKTVKISPIVVIEIFLVGRFKWKKIRRIRGKQLRVRTELMKGGRIKNKDRRHAQWTFPLTRGKLFTLKVALSINRSTNCLHSTPFGELTLIKFALKYCLFKTKPDWKDETEFASSETGARFN